MPDIRGHLISLVSRLMLFSHTSIKFWDFIFASWRKLPELAKQKAHKD